MIPIYIAISKRFDVVKGLTEKSILANTDAEVKITHLYPKVEYGCTGFSNVRFEIEYGIYLDPDMIVLGDIAELWEYRKEGKWVCMKDGSTEVAVIDCKHSCRSKSQHHLLPMEKDIPWEWNVEDAYRENGEIKFLDGVPPETKLFHFTSLPHQPWFYEHPNKDAVALYEYYKNL